MIARPASPGTISAGTLKTDDLLESFASELEHNLNRSTWTTPDEIIMRDTFAKLVADARGAIGADDVGGMASDILTDVIDALQTFAPENHYFGAHVGDGADFGYWEDDESTHGRHC